jgi:uncharacterized protein involved in exopolysaccharide biosynthesis
MKRLLRLAARLYPSSWRQRYAVEFEALLDDVQPGWRILLDIIYGALTMQIRTHGTIPIACALAGALVGGFVAMQIPAVYASSTTVRLAGRDVANVGSAPAQQLRAALANALDGSRGGPAATSVTLLSSDAAHTTVRITYADSDPVQAQRVAERLAAALATGQEPATSNEILDFPALPTSPVAPNYALTIAAGGAVGLAIGGVVVLLLMSRRRLAGPGAGASR